MIAQAFPYSHCPLFRACVFVGRTSSYNHAYPTAGVVGTTLPSLHKISWRLPVGTSHADLRRVRLRITVPPRRCSQDSCQLSFLALQPDGGPRISDSERASRLGRRWLLDVRLRASPASASCMIVLCIADSAADLGITTTSSSSPRYTSAVGGRPHTRISTPPQTAAGLNLASSCPDCISHALTRSLRCSKCSSQGGRVVWSAGCLPGLRLQPFPHEADGAGPHRDVSLQNGQSQCRHQ